MSRLQNHPQPGTPRTTAQMGALVRRIQFPAVLPALTAAVLSAWLPVLAGYFLNMISGRQMETASAHLALLALALGAVSLPVWLLTGKRRRRTPVRAYPCGWALWRESTKFRKGRVIALSLLLLPFGLGGFFPAYELLRLRRLRALPVERVEDPEHLDPYSRRRERRAARISWGIYWAIILAVYIAASLYFGSFLLYAPIPAFALVFFLIPLILHNPFRAFSSVRNRIFALGGRLVLLSAVVAGFFLFLNHSVAYVQSYADGLDYTMPEPRCEVSYNKANGEYTLRMTGDDLRILQLTDTHLCGSLTTLLYDRRAYRAIYETIREAQPDLIVVTGDLIYPIPAQTFSRDNLTVFARLCRFLDRFGIPWTLVYGNHDTEAVALYGVESFRGYISAVQNDGESNLLYADVLPEIYGRYNQTIRIENTDGSLNRLLFLIDSNDYVSGSSRINEYDSVHPDQIRWYCDTIDRVSRQEGHTVRSFVFQHIPFRAFADAQQALAEGTATYLFGENGEGVSCPARDTGFFDAIVEKGSTDAVFVGHDHLNHMAVRYRGVDLVYSRSIDYIAYARISSMRGHRGGTLITVHADGGYSLSEVVYPD